MATVTDSLQRACNALRSHSESPRLDAEILLCNVLGISRSALIVHGANAVPGDRHAAYDQLIAQRVQGVPVAYLTGSKEFWSLNLKVTPDVLVPRPETELLVELALALLPQSEPRSVVDLGTGSGAIALAIAAERPAVHMTGVDISGPALAVAMANARTLGLLHIDWRCGCWFDALPERRFDLIIANPPYIASGDPALAALAAEPALALDSGPTGLEALAAIIERAAAYLHARGRLLLEHGSTQADAVAGMLAAQGFGGIRSHPDYAGRLRVTLGTVPASH
jgi:release factor glutamine methyltransferase